METVLFTPLKSNNTLSTAYSSLCLIPTASFSFKNVPFIIIFTKIPGNWVMAVTKS